jgi:hypothetical protein
MSSAAKRPGLGRRFKPRSSESGRRGPTSNAVFRRSQPPSGLEDLPLHHVYEGSPGAQTISAPAEVHVFIVPNRLHNRTVPNLVATLLAHRCSGRSTSSSAQHKDRGVRRLPCLEGDLTCSASAAVALWLRPAWTRSSTLSRASISSSDLGVMVPASSSIA